MTENSVVKKVATAIADVPVSGGPMIYVTVSQLVGDVAIKDMAREAIEAHTKWLTENGMVIVPREPTEGMVEGAVSNGLVGIPSPCTLGDRIISEYQAMIDAALKEGE